jgi:hypothetical protein
VKISITRLPTNHWLAGGQRLNDWAQWQIGQPLRDEHFFVGVSDEFRRELRKQLKKALKRLGRQHQKAGVADLSDIPA